MKRGKIRHETGEMLKTHKNTNSKHKALIKRLHWRRGDHDCCWAVKELTRFGWQRMSDGRKKSCSFEKTCAKNKSRDDYFFFLLSSLLLLILRWWTLQFMSLPTGRITIPLLMEKMCVKHQSRVRQDCAYSLGFQRGAEIFRFRS